MQRGAALPLLILVVAIIVGTYFLLSSQNNTPIVTPKSVEVSNENTYKNEDYNFTFDYPKDLVVMKDSEEEFNERGNGDFRKNFTGYVGYEPGEFVTGVVVLEQDNLYEKNPFSLWVFDNPEDLSIETWYKNYWYYPFIWGDFTLDGKAKLAPTKEATVSGQLSKSAVVDYQSGKPRFIYLNSRKKMYLFRVIGEEGEKIIDSFKFTN